MSEDSTVSRYWILSDSGESHEPEEEGYRWMVEVMIDRPLEWELQETQLQADWDPQTVVRCDCSGPTEDMPWSGCVGPLVSDRLRRLLERHAPGHAQYLPVRMLCQGRLLEIGPYWIANWLKRVDCMDPQRSTIMPPEDENDSPMLVNLVVDPDKVPEDVLIFRIPDELTTLIHDDLRQILDAEGITGCQYYRVDHAPREG